MISHIAALSTNRVIGVEGQLPWKISLDLKYFKEKTLNKCMIMGRKTFDSLGRPLPGRKTVVITRDPAWSHPGCDVFSDIPSAIEHCRQLSHVYGDEIMIVGGAEIYRQTLDVADRLYLTLVDKNVTGDAVYPEWADRFRLISREDHEENGVTFSFCIFEKNPKS